MLYMNTIKNKIKTSAQFVLKLYNTLVWFLFQTMHYGFKNYIVKSKVNDLITILGNGPSFSEDICKLDFLDGDYCVVNYFFESSFFRKLKPKYYVLADPAFFQTEAIDRIVSQLQWEMQLFVQYRVWKKYYKRRSYKWLKIVPYNDYSYQGFKKLKILLYKKGLSMPSPQNVLIPCLFNAINMGYKEIRLYGADHSWTKTLCVTKDNVVCAVDCHFYKEARLAPYWKGRQGVYYKIHELLRDFANMFEGYHQIKEYANICGTRILNYTKDSFIDAFEKVE